MGFYYLYSHAVPIRLDKVGHFKSPLVGQRQQRRCFILFGPGGFRIMASTMGKLAAASGNAFPTFMLRVPIGRKISAENVTGFGVERAFVYRSVISVKLFTACFSPHRSVCVCHYC